MSPHRSHKAGLGLGLALSGRQSTVFAWFGVQPRVCGMVNNVERGVCGCFCVVAIGSDDFQKGESIAEACKRYLVVMWTLYTILSG